MQFHRTANPAIRRIFHFTARIERFFIAVRELRRGFGHNLAKHEVGKPQNVRIGAEILRQINASFHGVQITVVRLILRQEQRRICHTEPINTLLHVANVEPVILARHQIHDSFLYAVRILVFIDHDFLELVAQLQRHFGRHHIAVFITST